MERHPFRMTVATLLGLIACIAVNFWLFRLGILWGLLGLNVSKHIAIAYLCQVVGVDRRRPPAEIPRPTPAAPTGIHA